MRFYNKHIILLVTKLSITNQFLYKKKNKTTEFELDITILNQFSLSTTLIKIRKAANEVVKNVYINTPSSIQ